MCHVYNSADISISVCSTTNCESAMFGTKTYNIFTGRRPYFDEYLIKLGRLSFIESSSDVNEILIKKGGKRNKLLSTQTIVNSIVNKIEKLYLQKKL